MSRTVEEFLGSFSHQEVTEAINILAQNAPPTLVRQLGIFNPKPFVGKTAFIEFKEGKTQLVPFTARGGVPSVGSKNKRFGFYADCLHLPLEEIIYADDLMNIREFGKNAEAKASDLVNERLDSMLNDLVLTREYAQFCMLEGKLLDTDGKTVVANVYDELKLKRDIITWTLTDNSKVALEIEETIMHMTAQLRGALIGKWVILCSPSFYKRVLGHKSMEELYNEVILEKDGIGTGFTYRGVRFIPHNSDYGNKVAIKDGEAWIAPLGSKDSAIEYFGTPPLIKELGKTGKPYYGFITPYGRSEETSSGYVVSAQSNPLPMLTRPNLFATIKIA